MSESVRDCERGEGTRDWAWQRWQRTGHAHIGKGHDSTCRLSPAGSTLCTAMLFWLGALYPYKHTHIHAHQQIQLPKARSLISLSLSHI
ncbi:hypothetical protein PBY51_020193 [Eleginops maclovinus]|uniref:Uncharacterized protein n=1 Tax=Eleginops maclovinus TaxID=56733 RepID=A0AAN8AN06_ELEMC|nr:hypothetical protein PBY51_020193 [Eleginops maclovinus]